MGEIVKIHAAKDPDHVLTKAIGEFETVVILGYGADGMLDVRTSTNMCHREILWVLDTFRHKLLNGDYSLTEEADDE